MIMKETNGTGCGENQYFSLNPRSAFCCGVDPDQPWVWNGQNVWRIKPMVPENGHMSGICLARRGLGTRMRVSYPGCACKKGSDLKLKLAKIFLLKVKVQTFRKFI